MASKVTDPSLNSGRSPVFQCQQCGDCCSGRGGIFVKPQEVEEMAALLSLPVEEFCRLYVEASAMGPRLAIADNGFCVFLMEGNLCQVHPVKPFICRQWPFLPILLLDPDELEHAKTACPGINPACSHADFVDAALQQGRKNNL
ncbi:MAG: YkgJ family cysteine cluster protein [Desulfobaccales bacterium]